MKNFVWVFFRGLQICSNKQTLLSWENHLKTRIVCGMNQAPEFCEIFGSYRLDRVIRGMWLVISTKEKKNRNNSRLNI